MARCGQSAGSLLTVPTSRAIRVAVAATSGSAPREVGAAMLVTAERFTGTIGGGALEFEALRRAREMLDAGAERARVEIALGPEIGQCCGGRVTLSFEMAEQSSTTPRLPTLR